MKLLLASLAVVTVHVLGQEAPKIPATPVVSTFKADCRGVRALKSCQSFNEMIDQRDETLMKSLVSNIAFVCFRSNEDVFFVVNFEPPTFLDEPSAKKPIQTVTGFIYYERFKEGISESSQMAIGEWRKTRWSDQPLWKSSSGEKAFVILDESEITFGFSYENVGRGKTNYLAQVRRSTKRFVETFEWNFPKETKVPKQSRSSVQAVNDIESGKDTNSGYCVAYQ
jgi:hypothetical protein